jgi:RimJ/RimL family protein N-acetyltransferase
VWPPVDLDLGDLRVRTLQVEDTALVVEATSGEHAPAAWGPRPAGPYSTADAAAALAEWSRPGGANVSLGVIEAGRLVAALALMRDGPASCELGYWVRPEARGRGTAARAVAAVTGWGHAVGLTRISLEIDPQNAASRRVAERAGFRYERLLSAHCRSWSDDRAERDTWHDCQIWVHQATVSAGA